MAIFLKELLASQSSCYLCNLVHIKSGFYIYLQVVMWHWRMNYFILFAKTIYFLLITLSQSLLLLLASLNTFSVTHFWWWKCFVKSAVELNVDALPRLLRRCFLDGGCSGLTSEITDWLAELLSSQLLSWPKARRWSWPSSAEPGWESQVNISVCLCVFVHIRALTKNCFTVRTLLVLRVAQTNIFNNFTTGLGA